MSLRHHTAPSRNGRPLGAVAMLALLLAVCGLLGSAPLARAQSEDLLDRVTNQRMRAFEEQLTEQLNSAMARYISGSQYVLTTKVLWNNDIIPIVDQPAGQPQQQKLPGFPIFVKPPQQQAADAGAPSFNRLVVRVLLDETLPEYYERFVRKLVPIVARFDPARGDQVIVLKETFPFLDKTQQPPTLPEKELMEQLGQRPAPAPRPASQPQAQGGQNTQDTEAAAQLAYDEERYSDALRMVQQGFQRSTTNEERARFLSMEGSLFYTLENKDAARASWERALVFDPANQEVHRVLNFLDAEQTGGLR